MANDSQDLRKHADLMKTFILKEAKKVHQKIVEDNGITAKIEVCDKCECNPCNCTPIEEVAEEDPIAKAYKAGFQDGLQSYTDTPLGGNTNTEEMLSKLKLYLDNN